MASIAFSYHEILNELLIPSENSNVKNRYPALMRAANISRLETQGYFIEANAGVGAVKKFLVHAPK
ncbi:MAG: hypothetical protein GTO41_04465 [Burkholderiales bacterium]|nr:hypothetical protein [Burkholderiales bacterium]